MTETPSFRAKYAREYWQYCDNNRKALTDWELGFIDRLRESDPDRVTSSTFNKLKEIAEEVKTRIGAA